MTTIEAEKAGVKGYNDGRQMAPALNAAFIAAACQSPTDTAELLDAYTHGWLTANLADCAMVDGMPSVAELIRINAA